MGRSYLVPLDARGEFEVGMGRMLRLPERPYQLVQIRFEEEAGQLQVVVRTIGLKPVETIHVYSALEVDDTGMEGMDGLRAYMEGILSLEDLPDSQTITLLAGRFGVVEPTVKKHVGQLRKELEKLESEEDNLTLPSTYADGDAEGRSRRNTRVWKAPDFEFDDSFRLGRFWKGHPGRSQKVGVVALWAISLLVPVGAWFAPVFVLRWGMVVIAVMSFVIPGVLMLTAPNERAANRVAISEGSIFLSALVNFVFFSLALSLPDPSVRSVLFGISSLALVGSMVFSYAFQNRKMPSSLKTLVQHIYVPQWLFHTSWNAVKSIRVGVQNEDELASLWIEAMSASIENRRALQGAAINGLLNSVEKSHRLNDLNHKFVATMRGEDRQFDVSRFKAVLVEKAKGLYEAGADASDVYNALIEMGVLAGVDEQTMTPFADDIKNESVSEFLLEGIRFPSSEPSPVENRHHRSQT